MITVEQYFRTIVARLTASLGVGEGDAAARIIFEDVAGYDRKYLFMNGGRDITEYMQGKIDEVVSKVEKGEPVQYAVGRALFMGNSYEVSPAVLIPRPETAELVDLITKEYEGKSDLSVLDVGTGSGCIALSLARALPFSHVTGLDISEKAIEVAQRNAIKLKTKVDFKGCDILKAEAISNTYDIIVSNPPYICRSESTEMDRRVLDYEPDNALFVPDDDPLLFYKNIAQYATQALLAGGTLWFEINSRFPDEMRTMLTDAGFVEIDVIRDYRGLYRFTRATLPKK